MSHNTPTRQKSLMNIAVVNESAYDAKLTDDFILIRTKENCVINLPDGVIGKKLIIKDECVEKTGTHSIKTAANNTIDLLETYEFTSPLESVTIIFVETNWNIV